MSEPLREALGGLLALRDHAAEHDPVEIDCYCTDTDTGFGSLVCAWCKAAAAFARPSAEELVEWRVVCEDGRRCLQTWAVAHEQDAKDQAELCDNKYHCGPHRIEPLGVIGGGDA